MLAPSVGKYCIWRGPIVLESVFQLECVCVYETHLEPKSQFEGVGSCASYANKMYGMGKDRASLSYSALEYFCPLSAQM